MLKIADFVIRFRWAVIVVIAVITVFLGLQAKNVGLNADFSTYLNQEDPVVEQYNRMGDVFGGNSIGVALISTDNIFTAENLELVKKLTDVYRSVEGIAYVTSLTNVIDFRKTEWGLEVGKLLNQNNPPRTTQELAEFKSYVMQKDRYEGNLVSADGTTTAIILRFAGGSSKAVSQFATAQRLKVVTDEVAPAETLPPNTGIYFGGMPFLMFNMAMNITNSLSVLVPLMLLILLSILYAGFRHWAGVIFPLLVVGVSVIWVTGLMSIMGLKFDMLSGSMPVVLLALGSADGIHLLKRYFEHRRTGETARDSARSIYREMGMPILLTTVTTMVGFSSLAISDFSVIRQFGLLTALGVLLALVVTLTLLPALLSFGITANRAGADAYKRSRALDRLSSLIYRYKFALLAGSVGIIFLSAFAIPRIVKNVDWSLCLKKGSGPFHAEMLLRDKFGGSLPVQVLVEGDLKDPAVLSMMRTIERRLETIPRVSKSQSIAGIISEMNEAMNDRFAIPESRQGVANLWFLTEGEELMEQLVSGGDREALLQARLDTWHTASLVEATDSIDAFLSTLPAKVAVVDLDLASPPARSELLWLKREQIVEALGWDLEKYGVRPENEDLKRLVDGAMKAGIDDETRREVRFAVSDYLRGPEAEVELPDASIGDIIFVLGKSFGNRGGHPEEISRIIMQAEPGLNPEDADFLAESLAVIIRVTVGEARIAPALIALEELLPQSLYVNNNLRREVKGTLWQVNESLIYIDAAAAEKVLTPDSPALVREVSWRYNQTGLAPVLNRMEEELTPTQTKSLLLTLIFVIILLGFIFRSVPAGVLAVVPIAITILVNFGVMGYAGIGLDSFTAMIASIAIGLGIDYAIHFISRLRDELRVDGDEPAALKRTMRTTGVSIIINSFSVGLGFTVLIAAGGQHIRLFGGLTALTMMVSGLLTLLILPSLFLWLKPGFIKRAIGSGIESSRKRTVEEILLEPSAK